MCPDDAREDVLRWCTLNRQTCRAWARALTGDARMYIDGGWALELSVRLSNELAEWARERTDRLTPHVVAARMAHIHAANRFFHSHFVFPLWVQTGIRNLAPDIDGKEYERFGQRYLEHLMQPRQRA